MSSLLQCCGLRESRTTNENVFVGTWKMDRISCGLSSTNRTEIERYETNTVFTVTMKFAGSTFEYTSSGTCTTSSTGRYNTSFDGTSEGKVDFYDVLTGGTTCSESVSDSGTNTVGPQTISTTFTAPNTSGLIWIYDGTSGTLEIEYFAAFNGSSESVTCSGQCFCTAVFSKS